MGFLPDQRRRLDAIDDRITKRLEQLGHPLHRVSLGVLFIWLGLLKQSGLETGSSLIAQTVYWGPTDVIVPLLGFYFAARNGRFIKPGNISVELMGLYWHFVDVVWIFLFPLLYLVK